MWLLFFQLTLMYYLVETGEKYDYGDDNDLGEKLADTLINDAKIDTSADEEYEDLRAEFFAYRSALASLTASNSRRSMLSTSCWKNNGICINHQLCVGFRFLAEVHGCQDKLKVCCFVWDKYNVRDLKHHNISNLAMPWSLHREYGGEGVVEKEIKNNKTKKSKKTKSKTLAFIIRTN